MNLKLTQTQNLKRGFSLTEFSVVLGIVGVIFAGIWVLAASMNNSVKQEKFSEMLTVIVGNVRGNYTGKAFFESTLVATMMPILTSMNVFPGNAVRNNGGVSVVDSPFGQQSTAGLPAVGTAYNSLYVCGWKASGSMSCEFAGGTLNVPLFAIEALLSKPDCMKAILRNSNTTTLPGLVAIYSNGTSRALPMTLTTANTACSAAGGVNYVDFVFRLTP
jgi:prepilin-type N-terminal cleavage/methylation domain-containing protein